MIPRSKGQAKGATGIYQSQDENEELLVNGSRKAEKKITNKKDRMKQKKNAKRQLEDSKNLQNKYAQQSQLQCIREDSEQFSYNRSISQRKSIRKIKLEQMINKLQIVHLKENNLIQGCFGHSTVVFRRPIIQGSYYLEFRVMQSENKRHKQKVKNPPSARFGICALDYSKNSPLGQKTSIGYKTMDGTLISSGKIIEHGEIIKPGDILGMAIQFSPPHKHQKIQSLWTGSSIIFFKNGLQVCRTQKIYQYFYCPALSLYNYVRIQARVRYNQFVHHPQGYEPYANIFGEKINYQNLNNQSLLNQNQI